MKPYRQNPLKVEVKKWKQVPKSYIKLMVNQRVKEFGKNTKNFEEDEKRSIFFFIKDKGKIVSFGMLEPIKINYLKKHYNILGISTIISVVRKKGYGTILMKEMIKYLKKKGKTGLGFTGNKTISFYEKAGLKTKKLFGKRFAVRNPKTGEIRFEKKGDEGDGLYYEGKDKLISKMLKTKSIGYYWIPNLEEPHW